VVVKKRKISLIKSKHRKIKAQNSPKTPPSISQSKISSSFGLSLDSRVNNSNTESGFENKIQENVVKNDIKEENRQNEMELTDKPLKSMFLFKNFKEMPINCSEKDSITYKIGNQIFSTSN
jgi:hypothetical protein